MKNINILKRRSLHNINMVKACQSTKVLYCHVTVSNSFNLNAKKLILVSATTTNSVLGSNGEGKKLEINWDETVTISFLKENKVHTQPPRLCLDN